MSFTYAVRYTPTVAVDQWGDPIASVGWRVYLAGTTTPATLYTTEAKAATRANPAYADAAGNPPDLIVDPGSYEYVMVAPVAGIPSLPSGPKYDLDTTSRFAFTVGVHPSETATQAGLDTAAAAALQKGSNLSDVPSASTARTNLGLGSAATHPASDFDTAGAASALAATLPGTYVAVTEGPLYGNDPRVGLVGNDSTDNVTAMAAAVSLLTAAGGGRLFLKNGTYRFTSSEMFAVDRSYIEIEGETPNGVILKQMSTAGNGIRVSKDTVTGFGYLKRAKLRNLALVGVGKATSTGTAINGSDGLTSLTYQGQFDMENVRVNGWATGVRLNRFDNCDFRNLQLEFCTLGYYHDGNANSFRLGVGASNCDLAVRLGDGASVRMVGFDLISCGQVLELMSQSQAHISQMHFESCTGSQAFIHVLNGGFLTLGGGLSFNKNIGNDVNGVLVDNGGVLVNTGYPSWAGFTSKVFKKASSTTAIHSLVATRNLGVAADVMVDDSGSQSYPASLFISRQDGSVPAASANIRGLPLVEYARDASLLRDRYHFPVRDRKSGSDVYYYLDPATIVGTGNPEGVVTASKGIMFVREDAPDIGSALYFKLSGNGNTGWAVLGAVGGTGPAGGLQAGDTVRTIWKAGNYVVPPGTTSTSASLGSNLRLSPYFVPYNSGNPWTITATDIDISVPGSTGALFRVGIYADTGSFYPGALLLDVGTLAADVAAQPEVSGLSVSIPDTSVVIWIGGALQGTLTTQPTMRTITTPPWTLPWTTKPTSGEARWHYASNAAFASGALPATFPATGAAAVGGAGPRVAIKL